MNILHVISQSITRNKVEVTGSDVFVATLSNKQVNDGHKVLIVGDYPIDGIKATFIKIPIGKRRFYNRIMNTLSLKRIINHFKIDLVHAHSRAASWIAHKSTFKTGIPYVSTIHGRQKIHLSTKTFDVYGDKIAVVCENIKKHLIEELGFNSTRIEVIPNAIDFSKFVISRNIDKSENAPFVISVIGRTTGEKGNKFCRLCENVFPYLLEKHPNLQIRQVGGSPDGFSNEYRPLWEEFDRQYPWKVFFTGYQKDLRHELSNTDLVIGAGRVAIEASYAGAPVFPFGEACRHGLLSVNNFHECLSSNFGDVLPCSQKAFIDYDTFGTEINDFINNPIKLSDFKLKNLISEYFSVDTVNKKINNFYKKIIMKKQFPKHIPVLMYHKIPIAPPKSKHKTWITMKAFEGQMNFLKQFGFQTLTMHEIRAFQNGLKPMKDFPIKPIIITFDDGYVDNYKNAIPTLKKHGFSAIIFCLGDNKLDHNKWDASETEETAYLMNSTQLRELSDDGFEIGAHTMSHPHLPELNANDSMKEIADSKKSLENIIEKEVISFAYPYGEYNDEIIEQVRQTGFLFAFATSSGALDFFDDTFQIFRTHIFPRDNLLQFSKKTSSWYRLYFGFKHGK